MGRILFYITIFMNYKIPFGKGEVGIPLGLCQERCQVKNSNLPNLHVGGLRKNFHIESIEARSPLMLYPGRVSIKIIQLSRRGGEEEQDRMTL